MTRGFNQTTLGTRIRRWTPQLLTSLMLLAGLGTTAFSWRHASQADSDNIRTAFELSANQITHIIDNRVNTYKVVMKGVKGFFDGSDDVTLEEFRDYVSALQIQNNLPGIQAVGLAIPVAHADKSRHIAKIRQQNIPNYQIKPDGDREKYAPIIRLEPSTAENRKALGFDIYTEPAAREALQRSRDTGEVIITSRIVLIQDADKTDSYAFVMYLPIYNKKESLESIRDRQSAISAWVDVPFRINDLMAGLHEELNPNIELEIHDGEPQSNQTLMYHSNELATDRLSGDSRLETRRQINIAGRQWTLVMRSTPAFEAGVSQHHPAFIAKTGITVTLLLGMLTWQLAKGRTSAQQRYRQLFDQSGDGLLLIRQTDHGFIDANPSALRLLGYRHEELLDLQLQDILTHDELPKSTPCADKIISDTANAEEWTCQRKDGSKFTVEACVHALDGRHYFAILRDLTERKKAEQQLRLHAQVFEYSREGIIITDSENNIISANPTYIELSGYTAEEALGKNPRLISSGLQDKSFYENIWQEIHQRGHWQGEVINRRKNGDLYPQWLSISAIRNPQGRIIHHIGIMSDLSEHKAAEERIRFLSHFDTLTQLPNRSLLRDRTELAISGAKRAHARIALMFIDLDRFKIINDSLGPAIGDRLLVKIADRLIDQLHPNDTLCRQGGDEFILLLPNTDTESTAHVAQTILQLITQPFIIEDQRLILTASIGIAEFPQDGNSFEQLSQAADAALFRAKETGRNNFQFFTRQLHEQANRLLQIENELRLALEQNELRLHYQPLIDIKTSKIIGCEALVRWQHPEKGMIPPGQFIPIAEESGLILKIDDWVLKTAIRQVADWQAEGLPVVPVSVNLSGLQFQKASLYEKVAQQLQMNRLDPAMLELELTEGIAMDNSERTISLLRQFHQLGISLSIDDFGTGYSSLAYLKRFQIDKLKIDQSFVRELSRDPEDEAIVTAIISMAKSLGFKTIAEGVETREQLEFLLNNQCDQIQGYYFSKPLPANEFAEQLRGKDLFIGQSR
ncbi:EAL domain-containing protein [Methylotuvimicrobium sp. KM1]|uniref:bifunctional diguanylate cyclase/phosphodiesterase n=1 Tax=Methylotuvimicrobium sp. KM1 TaxID=3377707 RepID=UPI00384A4F81